MTILVDESGAKRVVVHRFPGRLPVAIGETVGGDRAWFLVVDMVTDIPARLTVLVVAPLTEDRRAKCSAIVKTARGIA